MKRHKQNFIVTFINKTAKVNTYSNIYINYFFIISHLFVNKINSLFSFLSLTRLLLVQRKATPLGKLSKAPLALKRLLFGMSPHMNSQIIIQRKLLPTNFTLILLFLMALHMEIQRTRLSKNFLTLDTLKNLLTLVHF